MKLNNISTMALNAGLRNTTLNHQIELAKLQKEAVTGRKADIGNELGAFSSTVVSFETQIEMLDQLKVTNGIVENRFSTLQASMTRLVEGANDFIGQITAELTSNLEQGVLKTVGQSALQSLSITMNVTFKGEYVLSGINSDSPAIVDYEGASGSAAKTAVANAFQTNFGFAPDDPAAANITPAAMEAFLDGPFNDLFNDANWQSLWSGSSDRGIRAKISPRELVETPTTGQAQAFRSVTAAAVMITEFSSATFSENTMNKLAEKSITMMSTSVSQIGDEQAKTGIIEERVKDANERMEFQKNVITEQLGGIADVDSYETAVRLNQLLTSLEASYAATARIQSLSLMNFIQ